MPCVGVMLHGAGGVSFPFVGKVVVVFGSLSEVVEDVAGEVGVDGVVIRSHSSNRRTPPSPGPRIVTSPHLTYPHIRTEESSNNCRKRKT